MAMMPAAMAQHVTAGRGRAGCVRSAAAGRAGGPRRDSKADSAAAAVPPQARALWEQPARAAVASHDWALAHPW